MEESMNIYGYIRVSSCDQNEDRQLIAMESAEVPRENIFIDKQSGCDFNRPMYREMLEKLKTDDVVFVKSIDRLGRNYQEVVEQWQYLVHVKKVDIVVIEMPLLDTRRGKDLIGTFMSDIVLQVLSFVAENERTILKNRQQEGIAAAKKRGVKFGRPQAAVPDGFPLIYEKWKNREITAVTAASMSGFSRSTFYKIARDYEPKNVRE